MGLTGCRAIHLWTFSGLVGAFLDLAITYFLLCASTLAYFASKFLGFFGLGLPCPCNGLFGNPCNEYCVQRVLVEYPPRTVSSVHLSVKGKFPFDSAWGRDQNNQSSFKVNDYENIVDRHAELEGEASCSSVTDTRKLFGDRDLVPKSETTLKEGGFVSKGKESMYQRPKQGIRRRRKAGADCKKTASNAPYDVSRWETQGGPRCSSSINKEICAESSVLVALSGDGYKSNEGKGDPADIPLPRKVSLGSASDLSVNEIKPMIEDFVLLEGFSDNAKGKPRFRKDEGETRVLEQALEEEHAAHISLQLELEKERNAAATAADEAMAMILRLQEEKASIEMEAWQYQRMVEEKSAYDLEEMNLLKEILLRRERETHVLEKEVEAYRQLIFGDEQLDAEMRIFKDQQKEGAASSLYSEEDPVLMLQQISESIQKKENIKSANKSSDFKVLSMYPQNQISAFTEGFPSLNWIEDLGLLGQKNFHQSSSNHGSQSCLPEENGMDMVHEIEVHGLETSLQHSKAVSSPGIDALDKSIISLQEQHEQKDQADLLHNLMCGTTAVNDSESEKSISCAGEDLVTHRKDAYERNTDACSSTLDTELHIHDVHVVDDKSNLSSKIQGDTVTQLLLDASLNAPSKRDLSAEASDVPKIDGGAYFPPISQLPEKRDINTSRSDGPSRLPPLDTTRAMKFINDMRRNSMSVVDYERVKLDSEVEWLREKLRAVQEGRDKLNFSVEYREREKLQLQLLEDIASQLQEIRILSATPCRAVRQASLPLHSPKFVISFQVISKKRRCRSVTAGVHSSS